MLLLIGTATGRDEEVVLTQKLPAVGATPWSRFLPSVDEAVEEWRFADRHTESRWKDE